MERRAPDHPDVPALRWDVEVAVENGEARAAAVISTIIAELQCNVRHGVTDTITYTITLPARLKF